MIRNIEIERFSLIASKPFDGCCSDQRRDRSSGHD